MASTIASTGYGVHEQRKRAEQKTLKRDARMQALNRCPSTASR